MSVQSNILQSYVSKQILGLRTVDSAEVESMFDNISLDQIVKNSDLLADEIVDTFRLSLITESLTEQYSSTYRIGAENHRADWLLDYIVRFWEPDELSHADPFKKVLTNFGVDSSNLDIEINEARSETAYQHAHSSGFHPIALTTYGTLQECITDYWYELQRDFFPSQSRTSTILSKVKGREALHTVQFRDLTAIQLESDPYLIDEIIPAVINFKMPGNHIPPVQEIESRTQALLPRMGGDVTELLKRIINHIQAMLGNKDVLGKLLMTYASNSEKRFISSLPNSLITKSVGLIRGGHGLVGEIVLELFGLIANEKGVPKNIQEKLVYQIKSIVKRWIRDRMRVEGFLYNGNSSGIE